MDNQNQKQFITPSLVTGLLSSLLLLLGLLVPMIDFSYFHEKVDIQYNLLKICKNVGLISAPWMGIPYGMAIGIAAMFILSFVKIPQLKLIPCMIILAMLIIMLVDMGNVIDWTDTILDKYYGPDMIEVNVSEILKSLMAGAYLLAAGLVTGIISSCFKNKETLQ